MLHAVVFAAVMTAQSPKEIYMFVNRDATQRNIIGKHMFESLIRGKWCVLVYVRRDGRRTIHVCKV